MPPHEPPKTLPSSTPADPTSVKAAPPPPKAEDKKAAPATTGAAGVKTAATKAAEDAAAVKAERTRVRPKKKFNFWLNAVRFFMKNTLTYVVLGAAVVALLFQMPAVLQKNEFYNVLKSGLTNYLCLAHELGIFEERHANKSLADRQEFIRFNRITFLRDYLKDSEKKIGFLAVLSDARNSIYWTELTEREAYELSAKYSLDFGTCLAAEPNRLSFPGAYRVTNK